MVKVIDTEMLDRVVADLVDAYAASGRPVVPVASGAELQAVLTVALIGPAPLEQYLEALHQALAARGLGEPEGTADGLPMAALLADGLSALSPEQAAVLAICPTVLRSVNGVVCKALFDGTAEKLVEDAESSSVVVFPPDYLPESRVAETIAMFEAIEKAARGEE
jgi:hypothetical protein